jgi:hypothetical protein
MYNTIPQSKEWLTINYVVNTIMTTLPGLYISKGERIQNDYIQLCKPRTCMAMQSKAWMNVFLFK